MIRYCYVQPKLRLSTNNDSQPVVLSDQLMENNLADFQFINIIPLKSSEEKLKCRKVRAVLRYHAPNVNKHPEQHAHHLLLSFYPFRNEEYLTDLAQLQEPGVLDAINRNRQIWNLSVLYICHSQDNFDAPISQSFFISDDELNSKIRSLNLKQRVMFDAVHDWAKCYVKNLSSISTCVIEPLYIFVTGNAGCGKSFLTKVLYQSLTKLFHRNPK